MLEVQGGPYADALAEPLAGLGRYYRDRGELEQAQRLYRRALHVVRVNDGLYSERQLPILRELLNGYRMTGDLQELDSRYDYYFRLYGSGQPPYTDVRLQAALAYLRWQREAVRLDIDESESQRVLALLTLNDELLAAVAADSTLAQRWYRELVLSQLRNLYLLEDRFAPSVEQKGLAPSIPLLNGNFDQQDFNARRLELMQRNSLSRGSDLLQELIARTSTTTSTETPELARLHLELGDWYQWHGSEQRAGEQYQQVVQLLGAQERDDLLQQWLAQPVELPDNGAFWQAPAASQPPPRVITVRYDVSARGRARNMQTGLSDAKEQGSETRFRRKLAQIRFRPRWISGVAEPALAVQRNYEILD